MADGVGAYNDLMAHVRTTQALRQTATRLRWDQEVLMPSGSAAQRAEENASLARIINERCADALAGDWLAQAEAEETSDVARANLRLIRIGHDRASRLPGDLVAETARVVTQAHQVWIAARRDEDVAAFLPWLEQIVALKRQAGEALADGESPMTALIRTYEPDANDADLAAMFATLRPRLVALRDKIMDAPAAPEIRGDFPEGAQLALARDLAARFGYDFARGRIDGAVHPASYGSGDDVRITTRMSRSTPFDCIFSTIHEVGHATYEQNIHADHLLTPLGRGASLGVHESQSRLFENQLARSRAFSGWLFERLRDDFGDIALKDAEALYRATNAVRRGFIRTEADEVQYNLHILLRFDLEAALISGDLPVGELEAAWNTRFAADFGYAVDRPSNGMLQDVHWAIGSLGYFATYTLGNIYAACLDATMRAELPDLDTSLAAGDPGPATRWMRDRVQVHGGLRPAARTIAKATGQEPGPEPLLRYLEAKFGDLYGF